MFQMILPLLWCTECVYRCVNRHSYLTLFQAVPETDDTTLTTFTFRVVLIGSLMCMLGTAISQLFFFKSNAPRFLASRGLIELILLTSGSIRRFSSYFVILVTYPAGKWLAQVLPDKRIRFLRWSFSLNPGPWSYKEHLLGEGYFTLISNVR